MEKDPKKAENGKFRPSIPADFDKLGPKFASLGQDEVYYQNLVTFLGPERAGEILSSLSDISWEPTLAMPFETSPFIPKFVDPLQQCKPRETSRSCDHPG